MKARFIKVKLTPKFIINNFLKWFTSPNYDLTIEEIKSRIQSKKLQFEDD